MDCLSAFCTLVAIVGLVPVPLWYYTYVYRNSLIFFLDSLDCFFYSQQTWQNHIFLNTSGKPPWFVCFFSSPLPRTHTINISSQYFFIFQGKKDIGTEKMAQYRNHLQCMNRELGLNLQMPCRCMCVAHNYNLNTHKRIWEVETKDSSETCRSAGLMYTVAKK